MKIFIAALLFVFLSGCGYKGPIQPNTLGPDTQNIDGSL